MLALKQFRDRAKGVPDLLNYAALIDDGIVLGKDGSLIAGWFFRGPDAASMSPEQCNYLSERVNDALIRLGGEWSLWFDAVRMPAAEYPEASRSHFPDRISRMIDDERRQQFLAEGAHFETEHAFVVMYTPPLRRTTRLIDLMYDDDGAEDAIPPGERQIAYFKRMLSDIEDALADLLNFRRMGAISYTDEFGCDHLQDELVNYLQFCLTGELGGLNIPPCAMYLDALMGGQELWAGDTPKIGENFICCLAIEGFPHESYPLMLSVLDSAPVAYRFSSRFQPLEQSEASSALFGFKRRWAQNKRGFWEQVFRTRGGYVNEDAVQMEAETARALSDASSGLVRYGYYTPVVVLMGPRRGELEEQARAIARQIRGLGFAARVETVNTMEAWLGTLPGHRHPNVRRPLLHSLNFGDLLVLSAVWPGLAEHPCPLYPPHSPPLLHAATSGSTPFRLNLHVDDVGHTMIIGPTGGGKSVLLGLTAVQHLRYQGAQVFAFDKGRSMYTLAKACGGAHYELASDEQSPGLCPLAHLETDTDLLHAEEWIATCYGVQTDKRPSPAQQHEIHRALSLMREADGGGRTLTDFLATVQDEDVRHTLRHYTIEGSLGRLLDSRRSDIEPKHITVFELDDLMPLGPQTVIPVLTHLFRLIERALTGRPTLVLIDEAWQMLSHPLFSAKLVEWMRVFRKLNAAVVVSTQSIADAFRSGNFEVLLENCATKFLLPNEEADKRGSGGVLGPRDMYATMGMGDVEIETLKTAQKKKHYYVISKEGRRLIDLGVGEITLAFTGVSSRDRLAEVRECEALHGESWPYFWLEKNGVHYAPTD